MKENDPLDEMDIQHVKLSDGSEIIAYINTIEGNMIIAERPMLINSVKTTNGYDTYYFTKYMPFAKVNLIKLNSRNVISASEVNSGIKEKYIKAALRSEVEDNSDYDDSEELSDEDMDLNFMESPSKKVH